MSDEPFEKFAAYLTLAQDALRSAPPSASRGNLRLVHNSPATLAERVSTLEETQEFRALLQAIETRLANNGFGSHWWSHSVGNWFRRSGLYHRLVVGESLPDTRSLLDGLTAELARRESTVTYLALVEHVYFHERRLDFGRYEIIRFSKEELDELLQSRVRADFYPWAVAPTLELSRYWWIVIREKTPTTPTGRTGWISVNFDDLDVVARSYTDLPLQVEQVVQELALFDWRPVWASDEPRWGPFGIPICLRVDDHLTASPRGPRADVSVLDTEPDFDSATGEEVGERPAIWFYFNDTEVKIFEEFVRREGARLHRALVTPWSRPLIEVASRFFAKAFMSDGLEQLLWHITTIEALAGEQGEGVIERLARRLAEAMGTSDAERKEIKKTFKDLYDFRSELVHGRTSGKVVLTRHLFEARQFARGLMRWFLRFLDHVQEAAEAATSYTGVPNRREILRLLDLEGGGIRKARWLLSVLPPTFPRYPDPSQ